MVGWILKKILGSKNQREIKRLMPITGRINELDEQFKALSDDELRAKTATWKSELAAIPELPEQWQKLDEILPEAFAVVKNAARRLTERQHEFTVCDQHDQAPDERREQYGMDITYGTNSEFGFDYLRDNGMATTREQQVQRGYNYAIVDEVDSILIDEARTPLIISGPSTVSTHQYDKWKPLVDQLVRKQTMLCNRIASEAIDLFERQKAETFSPKEPVGIAPSSS